jgi:hypothetical protein
VRALKERVPRSVSVWNEPDADPRRRRIAEARERLVHQFIERSRST